MSLGVEEQGRKFLWPKILEGVFMNMKKYTKRAARETLVDG